MGQIGLNKTANSIMFVDEKGIGYGIPKDSHGHPIFSGEMTVALVNSISDDDFDFGTVFIGDLTNSPLGAPLLIAESTGTAAAPSLSPFGIALLLSVLGFAGFRKLHC